MSSNCARAHLAAHSPQVSRASVNVHLEYHCLFALSSSRYFAISWTLLSFWMGENVCPGRDIKPVLELFDVVHHLLVYAILHPTECRPSLWYSSQAANLSHFSNGVVVRIVSFGLALSDSYSSMMTLFLMVVVGSGPSSHVADLPLLQQQSWIRGTQCRV